MMFENIIRVLLVLMLTLLCKSLMLFIQWMKEEIKNRKGKMVNGTFVKEEDL